MKSIKSLIVIMFAGSLLFSTNPVWAQDPDQDPEEKQEDPFDDDPFFQAPLQDFLQYEEYERRAREADSLITSKRRIDFPPRDISGPGAYPGPADLYPNIPLALRYNRVDGLFLGIRTRPLRWTPDRGRIMKMYGSIGYGFQSRDWQYSIGVERLFGYNQNVKFGLLYRNLLVTDDMWRTAPVENTLTAFFAGYDFLDYYHVEGIQPYMVVRTGPFFEHTLAFKSEDHASTERNTGYSLFGSRGNMRPNPAVDEGHIQRFMWTTGFHTGGFVWNDRFSLSGEVRAELGNLTWLDSDFTYNRYEAEIRTDYILDPSAVLRLRARGGSSTGVMPIQRNFALGGISTLRARSYKSLQGSDMLLINTELHLSSRHRQERPYVEGFNIDWSEFLVYVFLDAGWVNDPEEPNSVFMEGFNDFEIDNFKTDLGIGASLPVDRMNALRFELAWPTEDFANGPAFWVRFNPTF